LKKPSFLGRDFLPMLGPQIRLLPVPSFGVNSRLASGQVSRRSQGTLLP
jgi:hypothetical protein